MSTTKSGDKTKAQILADTNIGKVQWNKNLNFHALKAIQTAEDFTPSAPSDWTTAPVTQDAALNELGARIADSAEVNSLIALTGVAAHEEDLGAFTGTIIPDDSTIKDAIQALETDAVAVQTLTGVAAEAVNLGTFTGSTIPDNQTVKAALQAVETAYEATKPSHIIKYAGKHTVTAGEDTAEAVVLTISGVAATDLVFAQFEVADATSVILKVAPTTNTVTVTGTLKENDIIVYQVIRAL